VIATVIPMPRKSTAIQTAWQIPPEPARKKVLTEYRA